jgi:NTE family protein
VKQTPPGPPAGPPTAARDILDRINEITFNTALLKELRTLALLRRALAQSLPAGRPAPAPWLARVQGLRTHRLDGGARLAGYGAGTKLRTDEAFLRELHALGVQAAEDWLRAHGAALGRRSSYDLDSLLEDLG